MKLVLLSDFHLMSRTPVSRTDDAFVTGFKKLDYIIDYAKTNNASVLQAGDLTHSSRDFNVLNALINSLSDFLYGDGPKFYTIWGQHNEYYRTRSNDATTLGVLENIGLAKILNSERTIIYDAYAPTFNVYGCSWGEDVPPPKEASEFNILVIHESIGVRRLYPEDDPIDAEAFLKEAKEYDIILCGDIHRKFHIEHEGRHILNTGCILRHAGGEYELDYKPGFYVLDYRSQEDFSIKWEEIPHSSSEEMMSIKHLESKKYLNDSVAEFIGLVDTYKNKMTDPKSDIKRYLVENNVPNSIKEIILKEMEDGK